MDLIAIVLALGVFALLVLLIEGIERVEYTAAPFLHGALRSPPDHEAMDIIAIAPGPRRVRHPGPPHRGDRARMSASNAIGLVVSALICVYLIYALLRGEKF